MDKRVLAAGGIFILFGIVVGLWQLKVHLHQTTPHYSQKPLPPSKLKPATSTLPIIAVAEASTTEAIATTTVEIVLELPQPEEIVEIPKAIPDETYLTITEGCTITVDGTCRHAFSRPDAKSTVRASLRIGTVLLVKGSTTTDSGETWYQIDFAENLRYPERLTLPWYVRADGGSTTITRGPEDKTKNTPTTKELIVDRGEQKMYAYDGDILVETYIISTGRELTPTPRGTFSVYRKTPTRYMQGPIIGINTTYYDLPGVPWNLYFTKEGAVVHGAYWHDDFGHQHSNGCVNLHPDDAKKVYDWADLGTTVIVRD